MNNILTCFRNLKIFEFFWKIFQNFFFLNFLLINFVNYWKDWPQKLSLFRNSIVYFELSIVMGCEDVFVGGFYDDNLVIKILMDTQKSLKNQFTPLLSPNIIKNYSIVISHNNQLISTFTHQHFFYFHRNWSW